MLHVPETRVHLQQEVFSLRLPMPHKRPEFSFQISSRPPPKPTLENLSFWHAGRPQNGPS